VRKKLSILFILALMVGTLACGGEDEQQQPVQEPEPTEPTQVEPRDGTVGDDVQGYKGGPEKMGSQRLFRPHTL
jgi:hypothetical protein